MTVLFMANSGYGLVVSGYWLLTARWRTPFLPLEGATEVFRGATECGSGLTKGSDYPVATEVPGRGLSS